MRRVRQDHSHGAYLGAYLDAGIEQHQHGRTDRVAADPRRAAAGFPQRASSRDRVGSALGMVLGFDVTSWYGLLVLVGAGYLFWTSVAETGHRHIRWIWRKLRSAPPDRPADPDVVLGHPGGQTIMTPPSQLACGEKRKLVAVKPEYLIENKDPTVGIRDVVTGVRTRDRQEHVFDSFFAGLIGADSQAPVADVGSIPGEWLDGVHESDAFTAFLYWARFTRQGVRWEVVYDPRTRRNSYSNPTPTNPGLDARVRKSGEHSEVVVVVNSGDVPISEVEVDPPQTDSGWTLLTDALATYPIPVLEPGDDVAIPVIVVMGAPVSIELSLSGRAEGVPYERRRTVSFLG